MKTQKLSKGQRADIVLQDIQWTVSQWEAFCRENNAGLILEGGHVTGFITEPMEYRI